MDAPRKEFPDRPWTILEVADYLQVSERTIRSRIKDADMPHRYIGGALRFVRSEVDAWVARQPGKNGAANGAPRGPESVESMTPEYDGQP